MELLMVTMGVAFRFNRRNRLQRSSAKVLSATAWKWVRGARTEVERSAGKLTWWFGQKAVVAGTTQGTVLDAITSSSSLSGETSSLQKCEQRFY